MKVEVLIVGQGLAGTLLASALEELGKSFVILDQVRPGAASLLAAGIINPVTGRRYVKSWMYDELVPIFMDTYQKISQRLNQQVLHQHDIDLCMTSIKEENDLISQMNRYQYNDHFSQVDKVPDYLHAGIRSISRINGFRLDIQLLLTSLRRIWIDQSNLLEEIFVYEDLSWSQSRWLYQDIQARKVVFCEGAAVNHNPYFKDLPIISNKGQLIWIACREMQREASLKHQLTVSDFNQRQWVGATYEWKFDTIVPTITGLEELTAKLSHVLSVPFEITNHLAGLRPTTADRRPIIANHPLYTGMWALNGLGTKGSSIAPYLIKKFIPLLFEPGLVNEFSPTRLK